VTPGQFGGCLGAYYDPFVLNSDPNAPAFRVPNLSLADGLTADRLRQRRTLLGRLEDRLVPQETSLVQNFELNRTRAFALVGSAGVQRAFDLSREPAAVRERYGRHSWGQSHLLARRLVEAGVRFVTTVNGPSIVWDTHKENFSRLRNRLVPPME
jgi:hypothetical protein